MEQTEITMERLQQLKKNPSILYNYILRGGKIEYLNQLNAKYGKGGKFYFVDDIIEIDKPGKKSAQDIKKGNGLYEAFTSSEGNYKSSDYVIDGVNVLLNGGGQYLTRLVRGKIDLSDSVVRLKIKKEYEKDILIEWVFVWLDFFSNILKDLLYVGCGLKTLKIETLKKLIIFCPDVDKLQNIKIYINNVKNIEKKTHISEKSYSNILKYIFSNLFNKINPNNEKSGNG